MARATGRFKRYIDYMDSDHWRELRAKALALQKCCLACGKDRSLHVHHITYREFYDCELYDLAVLCEGCHDLLHRLQRKKIVWVDGLDDESAFLKLLAAVKRQVVKGKVAKRKPDYVDIFLPWFITNHERHFRVNVADNMTRFSRKWQRLNKRCKSLRKQPDRLKKIARTMGRQLPV